jgi:hypothetical protein
MLLTYRELGFPPNDRLGAACPTLESGEHFGFDEVVVAGLHQSGIVHGQHLSLSET